MKLIDKTIDLMEYTYRETSRKDRFPIKYRTIIFEMQTNSLNIYKMLLTDSVFIPDILSSRSLL